MYIEQIGFHLGRRDEVPNQELAARLISENSAEGVAEIASYLYDKNKSIASDCIKVLYEVGYLAPQLIVPYVAQFIQLLDSKHNRMVWGSMIALSTVVALVPEEVWPHREKILYLIENGTVITDVSGVRTLIRLAGVGEPYYSELLPDLLRLQRECRNVDFAKRAGEMAPVIQLQHRDEFRSILEKRLPHLSKSAQKRLEKVIKALN